MKDLVALKNDLLDGKTEEVVEQLKVYVAQHQGDAEAHFLLGNAYRKMENWELALNNYRVSMDLDPSGPARMAYDATIEVLDFFNKDMFNQ